MTCCSGTMSGPLMVRTRQVFGKLTWRASNVPAMEYRMLQVWEDGVATLVDKLYLEPTLSLPL